MARTIRATDASTPAAGQTIDLVEWRDAANMGVILATGSPADLARDNAPFTLHQTVRQTPDNLTSTTTGAIPSQPETPTVSHSAVDSNGATLATSAYSDVDGTEVHTATRWQVATDPGFGAGTLVLDLRSLTDLLSLVWNGGNGQTTYFYRAAHENAGGDLGTSDWSAYGSFTTAVASNSAPAQPTAQPAANITQTAAGLASSAFSDPDVGDTHAASQWQVTTDADTGFAAPVVSTGDDATHLVAYGASGLTAGTAYRYRVRHKDSAGNYSLWSAAVQFSTLAAAATATFRDDFTGTDGTLLPAHTPTWQGGAGLGSWVKVDGADLKIKSNRAYGNFAVGRARSGATQASNGILRMVLAHPGSTYAGAAIFITRWDPTANTFYQFGWDGTSTKWTLRKTVAGSFSTVAGAPADYTDAWAVGDARTAELETTSTGVIGRVYGADGTTLLATLTSTDTSITAGGYVGASLNGTDTSGPHLDSIQFTPS